MIVLLARLAAAADPASTGVIPPPEPDAEILALESAIASLRQSHDLTVAEIEHTRRELARALALLESAAILLDDRQPFEARVAAADTLAATGDPRALPLLRAGARDRDSGIQLASASAALTFEDPEALSIVERVLRDPYAPKGTRTVLVQRLANQRTDAAGEVLFTVSADRDVPARVRSEAVRALDDRYPEVLARHGGAPSVVDPLGGLMFVAANGVAGGLLLSSVGAWGQLDGGEAIGAVGGTAVGLGAGTVYAVTEPLSAGQGLAYASGVTWGYVYGRWTTTAVRGPIDYLQFEDQDRGRAVGGGFRSLGVLAGVGVGAWAVGRKPTPADVLEIDVAGYLGSAVALGTTGLLAYRPPNRITTGFPFTRPAYTTYGPTGGTDIGLTPWAEYDKAARERFATAELTGATLGLVTGAILHPRWELEPRDALFSLVLGGQAAWLGNVTPALVGADPAVVKGNVRLPWNAGLAGGLLASELLDPTVGRSASLAWGSVAGDALGAGLPMLFGFDDARSVATWMVPIGALGTAGGLVAHPIVDPSVGDATMLGVGTSIALGQGLLIGYALDDLGTFADSGQIGGLVLTASGATGIGLYGLSAILEPRVDETMVLGSAAGWGAFYGGLLPIAIGGDGSSAAVLLPAAVTSAAATVGAGLAMRPDDGLSPAATVIPQLSAASGATLGALVAGLASEDGSDAALGALIGATVGFGVGAAIRIGNDGDDATAHGAGLRPAPKLPGLWMPLVQPRIGADGSLVAVAGVQAVGW